MSPRRWSPVLGDASARPPESHTEAVRQRFNARSNYDEEGSFHPRLASWMVSQIIGRLHGRIADIATGTGLIALDIADRHPDDRVVGVDLSEVMLEQAERKRRERGFDNVEFRLGDAEAPLFEEGAFDAWVCCAGLVWMNNPRTALGLWRTWLAPGGLCAVQGFTGRSFTAAQVLRTIAASRGVYLAFNDVTGSPHEFRQLLIDAGYSAVEVTRQEFAGRTTVDRAMSIWPETETNPLTGALFQLSTKERNEARREFASELQRLARNEVIDNPSEALLALGTRN